MSFREPAPEIAKKRHVLPGKMSSLVRRVPNTRHDLRIDRHGRVLFQVVIRSTLPAALLVRVRANARFLLLPVRVRQGWRSDILRVLLRRMERGRGEDDERRGETHAAAGVLDSAALGGQSSRGRPARCAGVRL